MPLKQPCYAKLPVSNVKYIVLIFLYIIIIFKSCFVTPMQSCSKSTDHHELATTANHSQASQCYLQATRQGYLPLDKKKNI